MYLDPKDYRCNVSAVEYGCDLERFRKLTKGLANYTRIVPMYSAPYKDDFVNPQNRYALHLDSYLNVLYAPEKRTDINEIIIWSKANNF